MLLDGLCIKRLVMRSMTHEDDDAIPISHLDLSPPVSQSDSEEVTVAVFPWGFIKYIHARKCRRTTFYFDKCHFNP